MGKLILVAEDEKPLNDMITDYLTASTYETVSVYDGPSILQKVKEKTPSLLVLDLMLPGLDGIEVTRLLRKEHSFPIIMVTAKADEASVLLGLEIGADDYITKPLSMRELGARIRTVLRRCDGAISQAEDHLVLGPFEMIVKERTLRKHGKILNLTPAQFDFLHTLMKEPGNVFRRNDLIEQASGYEYEGYERTVDTHVKNIRRVIEEIPSQPQYLKTVWGVGYKFEV